MDVTLDLDPILGAGEIETLHRVLETEGDDGRLQEALTAISLAASEEYLEMMLGKQIPSRAQDVREHRLYLLLKRYFGNSIPSEAQIASFFQLTEAQSRSLLRNTRTKYRFDLDTALTATIQALLNTATQTEADGPYRIVITSENLLEELRHVVAVEAPQLDQISKVRGSAGVYEVPPDTWDVIRHHYGMN